MTDTAQLPDPATGVAPHATGTGPGGSAPGGAETGEALSGEHSPTWTGLSPPTAAVLAYGAWWVSGAVFLVLEPGHPFVAFHARQAFRVFGTLWLAGTALWALGFLSVFVSPVLFRALSAASQLTWALGIVLWGVCLFHAARGRRWRVPGTDWLGN
jgi:uncharacterized membrane protein